MTLSPRGTSIDRTEPLGAATVDDFSSLDAARTERASGIDFTPPARTGSGREPGRGEWEGGTTSRARVACSPRPTPHPARKEAA